MAHMIPSKPKEFEPSSREGDVFSSLSKLPDDYYVFHSYQVVDVNNDNEFVERELDFVIANPKKGILCIEVKAGAGISYNNRCWYYTNGTRMHHGGPYNQAASAKRALIDKIKYCNNEDIRNLYHRCKIMHAVLFPDMMRRDFDNLVGLPEESSSDITIFADDMSNPTKRIAEIFSSNLSWERYVDASETKLSDEEFQLLLDVVLCPHFKLIPSPAVKNVYLEERLNQLLKEQYRILDFLEEQSSAVINGAAGTGKTMIAVEKARRHSINGDKVLFLCYNRLLCEDLIKKHKESSVKAYKKQFSNVDFMTINKLTKEVTGKYNDYEGLLIWLLECADKENEFPYRHIIIDEGQDFGLIETESDKESPDGKDAVSIIDALQEVASENDGTFYLFYDKYQMIQGDRNKEYYLPTCIEDADCRLTLHCNCRNTKEIAKTSVTPLKDKKNKAIKTITSCSWDEPVVPTIHLINEKERAIDIINAILQKLSAEGLKDIVILTSKSLDYSAISDQIYKDDKSNAIYELDGIEYKVTTCKRFKGLEADAVIYIDLNKDSFVGRQGLEFYVGASRAKLQLEMICQLGEDDYNEVVKELDENAPVNNNAQRMRKIIGSIFSANVVVG